MKLFFIFLLVLIKIGVTFSQTKPKVTNLEIPELKKNECIIHHEGYVLSYNERHEQANWVAYELTDIETVPIVKRNNKFMSDPVIKTESANTDDYLKSGYDRGHLAPAGDMAWSEKSMEESFYYSNMSPQTPSFNRGIWKKLEEQMRHWANEYHSIYIATGPILDSHLVTIGFNNVSVPKYYYKVILNAQGSTVKGIGFILPNATSTLPLQHYAVTIDSVEKMTHINFFPKLDDNIEMQIEHHFNLNEWNWNTTSKKQTQPIINLEDDDEGTSPSHHQSQSTQCIGTTKKGMRCHKMTTNKNGKCYLHE
jgi:endonuclease G